MECRPISYFWDQTSEGTCIDFLAYLEYNSLANTIIDLCIVILPIREVLRLQMSNSKKIGVIATFSLGSVVVVMSATRLIATILLARQVQDNITRMSSPYQYRGLC